MSEYLIKKAFIIIILGLFVLAAGCSNNSDYGTNTGGSGNPPANQVYMQNMAFNPTTITVSKGTQIKWTNKDGFAHTVTSGTPGSPNGTFDSGNMSAGAAYNFTFNTSGTFKYYCRIHGAAMTATVVVQ